MKTRLGTLALGLALFVSGCNDDSSGPTPPIGVNPGEELVQLWSEASAAGTLTTLADRERLVTLIAAYLPEPTGSLSGYEWDVSYVDEEWRRDYFLAELSEPEGRTGTLPVYAQLTYDPAPDASYWDAAPLDGYPTLVQSAERTSVLVGNVEVHVVASDAAFTQSLPASGLARAFALNDLASL